MEGIPSKAKNLPMNLLLGKLYRISHGRAVVAIYKECLRHCPFILEAITALSELGSTAKDIISLFPQAAMSAWSSTVILLSGKQGSHNCRRFYCWRLLDYEFG
ncbi:hypothetical protein P8452_28316 [Trifolium repens]|nr:hypothetical protein P8452_28316 [Trifolium repens]